ncbi:hypothetical protein ACHAW6_011345 [Cyclotella cf. meneghiniana]
MVPSNKRLRLTLYVTLVTLRFLGAIYSQTGYVHPDEFFQGGQELFFGERLEDPTQISEGPMQAKHEYAIKSVPWEFEPENAVRSIAPPAFMTLFPLRVYVAAKSFFAPFTSGQCHASYVRHQSPIHESFLWKPSLNQLSGKEILVIPRLFMTILSLIFLDGSLWILVICNEQSNKPNESTSGMKSSISRKSRRGTLCILSNANYFGPPVEVILLASSWPCLVFGIRPFTNTLEATMLAFLLVVVSLDFSQTIGTRRRNGWMRSSPACIGVTCAIGIFVRFTFAFYAFPTVITYLWYRWKENGHRRRFFLYDAAWLGSMFLLTSAFFVLMDSRYYSWRARNDGSSEESSLRDMLRYIAPFNALLYNSKAANLAEHGLHPRITHAVVNMPMLFGPVAVIGYASVARTVYNRGAKNNKSHQSVMNMTCHLAVLSGLLVLSCAPHQEPRFLFPCIVPMMLLFGEEAIGIGTVRSTEKISTIPKTTILKFIWFVFNFILYIFFGWLHQGGLVDTVLRTPVITNKSSSNAVYIYYKTYMPPAFLARGDTSKSLLSRPTQCSNGQADASDDTSCSDHSLKTNENECNASSQFILLDLQGNEPPILLNVLQNHLPCTQTDDEGNHSLRLFLITPYSVVQSLLSEDQRTSTSFEHVFPWEGYSFRKDYSSPYVHVSTEDWPAWDGSIPKFLGHLEVGVYEVSCTPQ